MAVNRHYSAKPAVQPRADKPAVEPKAAKSQESSAKPKSTTTQINAAKPANGKRPKKAKLTPYEHKERNRKAAAQRRQNRKEQGHAGTDPLRRLRRKAPPDPRSQSLTHLYHLCAYPAPVSRPRTGLRSPGCDPVTPALARRPNGT